MPVKNSEEITEAVIAGVRRAIDDAIRCTHEEMQEKHSQKSE